MKINIPEISLFFGVLLLTACEGSNRPVENAVLRLTFDGENCVYEGPTLIKAGHVTFHFINNSGGTAATDFVRHIGDETIQDVIEYIGDEPSTVTRPPWAQTLGVNQRQIPAGESFSWERELEPGIHHMVCIRVVNRAVWFGTGLTVEE